MDLAQFNTGKVGYFILNTDEVTYCWPSGQRALTESVWWMKPGLLFASTLLLIPVVLNILKKNAMPFFWVNVAVLLIVIIVESWGIGYGTEQIESIDLEVEEIEYTTAFYFPMYAFAMSILAALISTFYGKREAS